MEVGPLVSNGAWGEPPDFDVLWGGTRCFQRVGSPREAAGVDSGGESWEQRGGRGSHGEPPIGVKASSQLERFSLRHEEAALLHAPFCPRPCEALAALME